MEIFSNLTIVIPTFYPGSVINNCINSLPNSSEIIIIDNSKNDEVSDLIRGNSHNIKYFKIGDVGLPKSFNFALEKAKNEYILITQPDVTFGKDTIQKLIEATGRYKNFGLLAPIIYENNQYSPFNSLDLPLGKNGELVESKKTKKVKNIIPSGDFCVEAVSATAMLLKKSILKKIGGWDENIYTYLEDLDLCIKLRRNKYQLIKIKSSMVDHIGFGSHKNENVIKSELSRNWHFVWSSLYFRQKYSSNKNFIKFLIQNFIKYSLKTFFFAMIFKKKKTILNFMRLRACLNYIFIKKSNFRIKL